MAYTKQTWNTGDVITSDKLNHMEDGIAGAGGLVITATTSGMTTTLDKTWQEIYDTMASGVMCVIINSGNAIAVTRTNHSMAGYEVAAFADTYVADTADGYPVLADG